MKTPNFKWAALACVSFLFVSTAEVSAQMFVPGGTGGISNNSLNNDVVIGPSLTFPTLQAQTTGDQHVGIGLRTPLSRLHVSSPDQETILTLGRRQDHGTCVQQDNWQITADVGYVSPSQCTNGSTPQSKLSFGATTSSGGIGASLGSVLTLTMGGAVGIGNDNPNYNLDVDGSGHFTGKVAIGTTNTPSGYGLYVKDGILCEEVKVAIEGTGNWADFVFEQDYELRSLAEVEAYILKNKHLPDVPSAEEVVENGVDLGEMNATLLRKVEELTLYVIELQKQNDELQERFDQLEQH